MAMAKFHRAKDKATMLQLWINILSPEARLLCSGLFFSLDPLCTWLLEMEKTTQVVAWVDAKDQPSFVQRENDSRPSHARDKPTPVAVQIACTIYCFSFL
jgi:hypothetical protein